MRSPIQYLRDLLAPPPTITSLIRRDVHWRVTHCAACGMDIEDPVNTMTRDEWYCDSCIERQAAIKAPVIHGEEMAGW